MKTNGLFLILIALCLCACSGKEWAYKVVEARNVSGNHKIEEPDPAHLLTSPFIDYAMLETDLAQIGFDGWELVSSVPHGDEMTLIFKKPR